MEKASIAVFVLKQGAYPNGFEAAVVYYQPKMPINSQNDKLEIAQLNPPYTPDTSGEELPPPKRLRAEEIVEAQSFNNLSALFQIFKELFGSPEFWRFLHDFVQKRNIGSDSASGVLQRKVDANSFECTVQKLSIMLLEFLAFLRSITEAPPTETTTRPSVAQNNGEVQEPVNSVPTQDSFHSLPPIPSYGDQTAQQDQYNKLDTDLAIYLNCGIDVGLPIDDGSPTHQANQIQITRPDEGRSRS